MICLEPNLLIAEWNSIILHMQKHLIRQVECAKYTRITMWNAPNHNNLAMSKFIKYIEFRGSTG